MTIPRDPSVRPIWIVAKLRQAGSPLSAVALKAGVSKPAVSQAILAPTSARLDEVVAAALRPILPGLTPQQLYPERYDADGNRLKRRRHRSTDHDKPRVQRRKAA